jgi:hypothetical protein
MANKSGMRAVPPSGVFQLSRLGDDALCVHELDMRELKFFPKQTKRVELLATAETLTRQFVRIRTPLHGIEYLADVATGSLFDPQDGKCRTSPDVFIVPEDV